MTPQELQGLIDELEASRSSRKRAWENLQEIRWVLQHQPDNIPAGTQVVSSVPIRGTNDALVHPRGAVGIITRTPTGEENRYLVRFPDGFVNPLTREEFDILKHFKDRVPGVASAPTDSPEFDLDQFVIYRCVSGSRAYGLETDDSDTDLRGVYLAPAELQWSLFGAPDQFEDSARQWVVWELQKWPSRRIRTSWNAFTPRS
jgi:hypothetical protein